MPFRPVIALVFLVLLAGCSGRHSLPLSDAATGYAVIAARDVDCKEADRGCKDAHLVKGEACLRLASAGEGRFQACAVRHLALGIDMGPKQTNEAGLLQPYFESLMEALRLRRDDAASQKEAAPFAAQLESRARAFRKEYPAAPAGYYYLVSARLKRAADAAENSPTTACRALDDAQALLRSAPTDRGLYGPELAREEALLRDLRIATSGCADA